MFKFLSAAILYIFIITGGLASTRDTIYGVGDVENDLFIWLKSEGFDLEIYSDLGKAVNEIPASAVLLIVADQYPGKRVPVEKGLVEMMEEKDIRYYLEYPSIFPGRDLSQEAIRTRLERGVVVSEAFGSTLSPMSILGINDCLIIPVTHDQPMVVLAKVAGLDQAAYGLTDVPVYPLLVKEGEGFLSLTKLSDFAKGRYGPEDHWQTFWGFIGSAILF
ncbi:MAG: hypothetical protein WD398_12985 [Cyclobacteriaceae bacterium]